MSNDVIFPINYDTSKVDSICDNPGSTVKEFGRSFIHNIAMVFGMGHAADYKFGKGDIEQLVTNIQKDMEQKKWEVTTNLFTKQIESEEVMIKVMNQILINLQQQSDYYDSIYEPQFQTINLLDNFRIVLLFTIIFVLITFINWK